VRRINYEETETFMVTKSFINNYRFMTDRLFES
jgi:hypothetical protein